MPILEWSTNFINVEDAFLAEDINILDREIPAGIQTNDFRQLLRDYILGGLLGCFAPIQSVFVYDQFLLVIFSRLIK